MEVHMKATSLVDKKTGRFLRQSKLFTRVCNCGKEFSVAEWRLNTGRGLYCSKPCMYKFRTTHRGESHKLWKGEDAKYSARHKWVQAHYGKKKKCDWCNFTSDNTYQFHWANISGKYLRTIDDWARLCAKCHWHYDRQGIKHHASNG